MKRCAHLCALLVLAGGLSGSHAHADARSPALEALVEQSALIELSGERINVAAMRAAYRARHYEPIWLREESGLSRAGKTLFKRLETAGEEGLDPDHFHIRDVRAMRASRDPATGAKLELFLSHLLIHYATDVGAGRLDPKQVDPQLFVFPREILGAGVLDSALRAQELDAYLDSLAPQSEAYRALRLSLRGLREIAQKRGYPKIADGPTLALGMDGPRVATLKERLQASGDLEWKALGTIFDAPLESAVKRFQRRHGLAPDGVAGPETLSSLNVPVEQRIEQILVNMERLRWLPDFPGPDYVLVNIASFDLTIVEKGERSPPMRVVVGRLYRQTPVLVSRIDAIEINPYWSVPPSIASADLLPKILADPAYLPRNHFEVFSGWGLEARKLDPLTIDWRKLAKAPFPYKLRQEPGPHNALGRYKFRFPNQFGVYLHDTPSRSLFESPQPTFSSGCIRVEDARRLAQFLLREEPQWTSAALDEAEQGGANQTIKLSRPAPILVTYATAWVDNGGTLQFRPDIYGRDRALAEFLRTKEERQAPAFAP